MEGSLYGAPTAFYVNIDPVVVILKKPISVAEIRPDPSGYNGDIYFLENVM